MLNPKRWSAKTKTMLDPFEFVMMILSFFSVVIVLILAFAKLDKETYRVLLYVDTTICVIFMTRFFIGLTKARDKKYYLRHHWIDFIASIPAIEALRIARVFQILRVIRLIRMSRAIIWPLLRQRKQTTLASLLLATVLILANASVLILLVESGVEGANIHTAEQAIWWALVTISTVGYGDFYPVSTLGHLIGGIVIISGVSFFGVISGYMASVFVAPDEQERKESQQEMIKNELEQVLTRMEANQRQMEKNQTEMLNEIAELKDQLAKK
ncbi:ion transporter [Shewanella aestuarii]|uniref:Ion transporter n=1 Tax=Shewanella aestuarii TaxID=1028752 RepID=A0A6G9QIE4_9GAMM|nr:ion transporter [Shewanella aestuarii]QIR13651.1 ion transporter [Shewanella aestuarii]